MTLLVALIGSHTACTYTTTSDVGLFVMMHDGIILYRSSRMHL